MTARPRAERTWARTRPGSPSRSRNAGPRWRRSTEARPQTSHRTPARHPAPAWAPRTSRAYAAIQVDRAARERGVPAERVTALVGQATVGRDAGFIGAPFVNVLELNLALDRAFP